MPASFATKVFPLQSFRAWLQSKGAAASTEAIYVARVRALLGFARCPSDDLQAAVDFVSEQTLGEYLGTLGASTASQFGAAWRSYSAFAEEAQVNLPQPSNRARAVLGRADPKPVVEQSKTDIRGIPLQVAAAIWHLAQGKQSGFAAYNPGRLVATLWRDLVFEGGNNPFEAHRLEINVGGCIYPYRKPLKAFKVLWDWGRGDTLRPYPAHPLLANQPGSRDTWSTDAIHAVLRAGQRGDLPPMVDDELRGAAPPQLPLSIAAMNPALTPEEREALLAEDRKAKEAEARKEEEASGEDGRAEGEEEADFDLA